MESFAALRRRTTDLFQNLPQSLPAMPNMRPKSNNTMKGTWERISIPPLPRSSHSLNIVAGTAYLFGGEVNPRQPVDNDMHAIILPFSGAPADYYAIKAVAAKPPIPTINEPEPVVEANKAEDTLEVNEGQETAESADKGKGKEPAKDLDEVPLASPPPAESSEQPILTSQDKGKGKAPAPAPSQPDIPPPRVGHATAVLGSRIFLFGGRAGPAAAALEEHGRVWIFDTKTHLWSFLDPAPPARPDPLSPGTAASPVTKAHFPAPRSFHSAVATDKPDAGLGRPKHAQSWAEWAEGDSREVGIPQAPIVGNVAAKARDVDADGFGTFIVHGGCLAEGRTNDVWAFDVRTRVWSELPSAPGKPRGGAAICVSKNRLYRFGGFNGEGEEGGQLDYLELGIDTFDDSSTFGEVTLIARGTWQSLLADPGATAYQAEGGGEEAAAPLKETSDWPGNRSVASLEAITLGGGWEYLVLMLGEREPSGSGHEAAGKFWDDVWAFQVPSQGMSAASVTNAIVGALRRKKGEAKWSRVEMAPFDDEDDASLEGPGPRGWVASAPMGELEENGIVVFGGLNDANKRLGDGWIMRLV